MSGNSVGGLFLQVKLKTDTLEQQFKDIARQADRAAATFGTTTAKTLTAAASQSATTSTTASRAAKEVAAAATQQAAAARDIALMGKLWSAEIQRGSREMVKAQKTMGLGQNVAQARTWAQEIQRGVDAARQLQDNMGLRTGTLQARTMTQEIQRGVRASLAAKDAAEKEANARSIAALKAQQEAVATEVAAKRTAEMANNVARAARSGNAAGALGAGAQELFVGLGAARSGNYFYGLAAFARYGKNVSSALGGMSTGAVAASAGIAAVGAAALVAGGSLAFLTYKIGELGVQSAVNIQLARAQFTGLLGSASAASAELEYLFALAQRSTVPTDALITLDRRLITAGISATDTRQDIVDALSTIGTASQLTSEQVGGLVYVLGQVASQGRATRIDLTSQFPNNGVGYQQLMSGIAEATGRSMDEVKAALSDGGIAAQDVFAGLVKVAEDLAPAADLASKSVVGLIQNIGETVNTGFGQAFESAGVADAIGRILQTVQAGLPRLLEVIKPTAAAFQNLFAAISEALGTAGEGFGNADPLNTLFGTIIPGAVNAAAAAVRGLGRIFKAIGPVIVETARSIGAGFTAVVDIVRDFGPVLELLGGAVMLNVISTMTALAIAIRAAAGAMILLVTASVAYLRAQAGDWEGATRALEEGGARAKEQWDGITAAIEAAQKAATGLSKIDLSNLGGNDFGNGTLGGGDFGGGPSVDLFPDDLFAPKVTQEMRDAVDGIIASMRRFAGARSTFQAGLLGAGRGFTATAEQIISSAKGIRDALRQALPAGAERDSLVAYLKEQTIALARLADRRDRIADQLADAQARYESLLNEQASFAASITDGFTSFVNSLQLEEREVNTFARNAGDGFAGWVTETRTETVSFQESLRDRLAALKDFVANIRSLQARGLDPGLVRQFIEAGPDAAGEVVSQLAQGGSGAIREVNAIQSQLNSIASSFSQEQAGIYYDAGVQAAAGQVAGLESKLSDITDKAQAIVKSLGDELQKAVDPAYQAGADTMSGFGAGLESMGDKVVGIVKDISREIRRTMRNAVPTLEDPETQRRFNAYQNNLAAGLAVPATTYPAPYIGTSQNPVLTPDSVPGAVGAPTLNLTVQIGERDITDIVRAEYSLAREHEALAQRRGSRTVRP